jgi:heme exporter protein C
MKDWYKFLAVVLLIYVHVAGLLSAVPRVDILNETIRALYFHVPMWFGMVLLLSISVFYAYRYLTNPSQEYDIKSVSFANIGILFGILGMITGVIWAQYTWNFKLEYYRDPRNWDPKQMYSAVCLLIYAAYFVLRMSVDNHEQRARLSAVYNIFAFASMIPLLFILPRLHDSSLHPGNGGNPGFNAYDLDNRMRMIFYPAIVAWFLAGVWLASQNVRVKKLKEKFITFEDERPY